MYQWSKCPYSYFSLVLEFNFRLFPPVSIRKLRQNKKNKTKTWSFWLGFLCFAVCFLRVFQEMKRLKNLQIVLFQIKNTFFVLPSVFPLLQQDIWLKHVAKWIEFAKTNKKCTQNLKDITLIKKSCC